MIKKVIIASLNPVKIESVKLGFSKIFPHDKIEYQGVAVPSGVNDQPMSSSETLQGAINRASNGQTKFPSADFWIGIEGGIEKMENEMMAFAWIVVQSNHQTGKAKTGTFFLPPPVVKLIDEGKELGEADDIVFGDSNSKQKNGAVGLLTGNVIDRTSFYVEAVVLALIPFLNEKLYGTVNE